jgi:hypothetical protein
MIIAFVQIPLDGPKRSHEVVIEQSLESIKNFHNVKGLRRKYYLDSDDDGDGVNEFATRADAEAWFNDEWADWPYVAQRNRGRNRLPVTNIREPEHPRIAPSQGFTSRFQSYKVFSRQPG